MYGLNYWNTEASQQLKCRFNGVTEDLAYFVNITLVVCNLPNQATPGITRIEITIDSIRYSINYKEVEFISPPTVTSLDITSYFYTPSDKVTLTLTGTNLDKNRDNNGTIFVKVDDVILTVSNVGVGQGSVSFDMPKGMDVGVYQVFVSTDGVEYRPSGGVSSVIVEIQACPNGYFCRALSATICQPGYYCPQSKTFH